jgi:hypothetical protein
MVEHNYAIGMILNDSMDVYYGSAAHVEAHIISSKKGTVKFYNTESEIENQLKYYRKELPTARIHKIEEYQLVGA